MWIYISLLASQALCTAAGVLLVVPFAQRASERLHALLLKRVIRAPTSFFDKTPVGRYENSE